MLDVYMIKNNNFKVIIEKFDIKMTLNEIKEMFEI
jgi:hypothetical protein